jgi:hypothetical protein
MRRALTLAGLLLATLLAVPAAAEFRLQTAAPQINDRRLHLNTVFALGLNPKTEEALHKGIPLVVRFDIRVVKHRWWWANQVIADWELPRRLQFHALSRQYLVSGLDGDRSTESFNTLARALEHFGRLDTLAIPLTAKKQFEPGARYFVQLRASLDIETLPALMRPLAYATPSWRLNSGWSTWPVEP